MSLSKREREQFMSTLQEIRRDLVNISKEDLGVKDAYDRLDQVLDYNIICCKNRRGMLVMTSFQTLVKSTKDSDLKIAFVLGWCVEMLYAYFYMSYDCMTQQSLNPHGKQCWHEMEDTGILSVNDSVFVESSVYYIIKKFISDKPYYGDVTELFLETTLHRIVGQRLELSMCSDDQVDLKLYTMGRYKAITVCKSAICSFYHPVACAMYMADITHKDDFSAAKKILLNIGKLVQIQDDYNNCFGEVTPAGGWGSDIKDRKCTWLIVRALERASDEQKENLQNYFNQEKDKPVSKVMEIYKILGLKTEYTLLVENKLQKIKRMIHSSMDPVLEPLFRSIYENVFSLKLEPRTADVK